MAALAGLELRDAVLRQYTSEICACSRRKQRRKAFCPKCLGAIPKCVRAGLDRALIEGAAETYRECAEWLMEEGYVKKGAVNLGLIVQC